jgi:hypothetical protein
VVRQLKTGVVGKNFNSGFDCAGEMLTPAVLLQRQPLRQSEPIAWVVPKRNGWWHLLHA